MRDYAWWAAHRRAPVGAGWPGAGHSTVCPRGALRSPRAWPARRTDLEVQGHLRSLPFETVDLGWEDVAMPQQGPERRPELPGAPVTHQGRPDEGSGCQYRIVRSTRFTQRAFEFIEARHLDLEAFWASGEIITVRVDGYCPRCLDHHSDTVHPTVVGEAVRAPTEMVDAKPLQLVFVCTCDGEHEGRPDGARGCGLRYRVEAEFSP